MKVYRFTKEDTSLILGVMRPTGMPMTYSTTSRDVYEFLKACGIEPEASETVTIDQTGEFQYTEYRYSHIKYYYTV